MYWSSVVEYLVEQRLAEARAGAAQRAVLRSLRPARQSLRARVALWLIAAGERLLGAPRAGAPTSSVVRPEHARRGPHTLAVGRDGTTGERAA